MTTATLVPGIYNSTPPSLGDGDQVQLQVDSAGNLKMAGTVDLGTTDNAVLDAIAASLASMDDAVSGAGYNITQIGGVAISRGASGVDTGTQRVVLATNDAAVVSLGLLDDTGVGEYETVAASQTNQVLGPTGGTGDWLESLLVVPATTSPGNVIILDNATSITVFAGGASSVATLHPFTIMIRARSVSGSWRVTTGANVSVFATGNFT